MKRIWKKALAFICAAGMLLELTPMVARAEGNTGTFTAVSMNVDGLPNKIMGFPINSDGPGSAGTKVISAKMAEYGWDIIGVSEDFNYNTELLSGLTGYASGTHRGGVSGLYNATDGLNLIWKDTISVTGEKCTSWNTHYSTGPLGTGNGADGMIDKGYRYYQATLAEGVAVDVYILHMDADSDAGDIAARESQLTQLADAIKASKNGNPILVMGDTNCRYTRENLEKLFIDTINADERFTVQDAWIEKVRDGEYPAYGADDIVAKDKGGTYDYPEAEIVDKVFYINNTDSTVTLAADSYTIATDFTDGNGTALADHWPVVVQFSYEKSQPEEHVHEYEITSETKATCTEEGTITKTCKGCGDVQTETIPALKHKPGEYQQSETEHWKVCTVCGAETERAEHSLNDENTCTVCEYVKESTERPTDPVDPIKGAVLGSSVLEISDGAEYVISFSCSKGDYLLGSESGSDRTKYVKAKLEEGMEVTEDLIWKISEVEGGYTISTDADGSTYYLCRSNVVVSTGYSVRLSEEPFVWQLRTDKGDMRFYTKTKTGKVCYLRVYNEKVGWAASSSAAGLVICEVDR